MSVSSIETAILRVFFFELKTRYSDVDTALFVRLTDDVPRRLLWSTVANTIAAPPSRLHHGAHSSRASTERRTHLPCGADGSSVEIRPFLVIKNPPLAYHVYERSFRDEKNKKPFRSLSTFLCLHPRSPVTRTATTCIHPKLILSQAGCFASRGNRTPRGQATTS